MGVRDRPRRRRWLVAAALAAMAVAGTGWLTREQRLAEAERRARAGDLKRAAALARPLAFGWGRSPRALRVVVDAASRNGDWAEAERALAALPHPTPAEQLNRASLLAVLDRPVESAEQWGRCAALPQAGQQLLDFLDLMGKSNRANHAFDLLLALADRPPVAFPAAELMLADRLRELGFPREAARRLERPLQRPESLGVAGRLQGARAYLSVGRPDRAAQLLQEEAAATPEEHADRLWLRSRVALQQGDAKAATAWLDRLRSVGPELADRYSGQAAEPAPLVGSHACAKCHRGTWDAQSRSGHATALAPVTAAALGDLPPVAGLADALDPALRYTLTPHGEAVAVRAERAGRAVGAGGLRWRLGSGVHGHSFLAYDDADREIEFALSHYTGIGWDATTGHVAGRDRANPLGRALPRLEGDRCLGCHSTNVEAIRAAWPRGQAASELPPEVAGDLGVRCESCHGPGLHHVRAAELGLKQDRAIRQPARLPAAASVEVCAACHQPSKAVDLSEPESVRFHSATLRASRCFESGKLSCVTCHDLHALRPRPAAEHGKRCLECHARPALPCPPFAAGRKPDAPAPPLPGVTASTSEAASCINCHMPPTAGAMKHISFTDHRIRVHRPPEASPPAPSRAP